MADSLDLRILDEISPVPTAPFYESRVGRAINKIKTNEFQGLPIRTYVYPRAFTWSYEGDPDRNNPKTVANLVHLDHPAFHITHLEDGTRWAKMRGNLNPDLVVGSQINLYSRNVHDDLTECIGTARLVSPIDRAEGNLSKRYVLGNVEQYGSENPDYATLSFPETRRLHRTNDGMLRSPVMDDFSAIAMSIAALKEIATRKLPIDVHLVFHRAEEVGLLGAYAIAESGVIPKDALVYSIENSSYRKRTERGIEHLAELGGGIIIRTGDKTIPAYDPIALDLLRYASPTMESGKTQERCMTGGTCEAGIYGAFGYRVAGIAVPLKNYHNDGTLEGHNHFVPEEIAASDFYAGTELMIAAAEALASRPELYGDPNAERHGSDAMDTLRNKIERLYEEYKEEGLWELFCRP